MYGKIQEHLQNELQTIEENGIFKSERIITSPQGAEITISTGEWAQTNIVPSLAVFALCIKRFAGMGDACLSVHT